MTIRKAITLAEFAHTGQTRIGGAPFVTHPMGVAQRVSDAGFGSHLVQAAWLHDVVEDGAVTFQEMRHLGIAKGPASELAAVGVDDHGRIPCTEHLLRAALFSDQVVSIVMSVSRRSTETYNEYIDRVCTSPESAWLKLHDIDHNTSPESTQHLTEQDRARKARRYDVARVKLLAAVDRAHSPLAA